MEDYKKRVLKEKNELDEKIVKLSAFLFSEKSAGVDEESIRLMQQQIYTMMDYSIILGKRLLPPETFCYSSSAQNTMVGCHSK